MNFNLTSFRRVGLLASLLLPEAGVLADPARVISVLYDFEPAIGLGGPRVIEGEREYNHDTPFGSRCWQLTVNDPVPFSGWLKAGWEKVDKLYLFELLKIPHFPPEVDAVRLRCKVVEGHFKISVGGPVIQSGTSDVFSDVVELDANNCAEWRTIDLSLNHRLFRNFRRARFSKDSPVIYQTRWGQENFWLMALKRSEGVILIDQIELISLGEGRPFPVFADHEIRQVRMIADFEDPGRDRVFSLLHGYDHNQGLKNVLEQSWRRRPEEPNSARWLDKERAVLVHEPVRFNIIREGMTGKRSLSASALFAEELSFALIRTKGEPLANALELLVRVTGQNPDLQNSGHRYWGMAVDFLALVATEPSRFPWHALEPTPELRKHRGPGFDYEISLDRMKGVSYGYYHARRLLQEGEWTKLVIPFADFVCGYGQGEMEDHFRQQLPLDGESIIGLMYTGPIRFDMNIDIDRISYVHVAGTSDSFRSFWQVPDTAEIELVKRAWLNAGGVQMLPRRKP